jgi:EmrB/QacA subfamily drug resistance transporter
MQWTRLKRWTMVAAVLGSGVVFLDGTVIGVALPRIGRELPVHLVGVLEGQSYVYNAYLLSLSAVLILAGALSDFYGRKRTFAIGLTAFGIASVLCGLAPNMELLILFRFLQGLAGAFLVPGSLSIITATFTGEENGRAIGIWASATSGTVILGPFVGGVLVDSVSWRSVFFINVPLIAIAIWALLRHVEESRDDQASSHFDWIGALIVGLTVGGLAFGAIYGEQRLWRDPLAYVALAIGAVGLVILPFWMARAPHPLIPLRLFRSRNFTITNITTLVIYGALYVYGYNAGLFMQGTLGYTAAAAGLSFLPAGVMLAIFSPRFGALAGRYGPRLFMALGPAVMALGVLWLVRIPSTSVPWLFTANRSASFWPSTGYFIDVLPASLVFAAGLCTLVAPLTTALMTSVPVHNSGLASAINNAISRIGPQLAGAVVFIAITASFYQGLQQRVPTVDTSSSVVRQQLSPLNRPPATVSAQVASAARQASTDAFHLAVLITAGLLLCGAAINGLGIVNRPAGETAPSTSQRPVRGREPERGLRGGQPAGTVS